MMFILPGANTLFKAWIADTKSILLLVLLVGIAAWAYLYLSDRHAPPGPPRLPFLGNMLQLPKKMQFLRFTEWSQQYGLFAYYLLYFCTYSLAWPVRRRIGPIFSLKLLGQNIVVLSSHKAATDLLGM
jgi:hypothetical protein